MDKKEEMPILLGLAAEWNRAELGREFEHSTRTWSKSLDPRLLALEWNRLPRVRPGENSQSSQDIADSLLTQHLALSGGALGTASSVPANPWLSWLKAKKGRRSRKRKDKTLKTRETARSS